MERSNQISLGIAAVMALLVFSGCGSDSGTGSPSVEKNPLGNPSGLSSGVPKFTLNKNGVYSPLVYTTDSNLELVECSSDSPNVLVGCSTENAILHLSAVALSGADATQIHFQVRNADQTFDRVEVPIAIFDSCGSIQSNGYAGEDSTYIVHNPADAPGVNNEVYCDF